MKKLPYKIKYNLLPTCELLVKGVNNMLPFVQNQKYSVSKMWILKNEIA